MDQGDVLPEGDGASAKKRLLILGGGFGGVYAALHLEKKRAGDPGLEITLVSEDNFFLFTPMLHEVAASDLDPGHIVNPIRKMLRKVTFFEAGVESIDTKARRVAVCNGAARQKHTIEYDYLLIALGSETNFFGIEGLGDRSMTMKTLTDAVFIRNRILAHLEAAAMEEDPESRKKLLTFVVAGGGFAGVETIGAVNDFVRDALQYYPRLREDWVRVVLVHPQGVILPELGESLGRYAQKKLAARKVEILLNARVTGYTDDRVQLSEGEPIDARILIWTAGVTASTAIAELPCKHEKGRLAVNEFFEVPELPGVWAVGDCAWRIDPGTGKPYPPTAQHAMRQGKTVAHNLAAELFGKGTKKPFRYRMLGQLAAIGQRTGVANILGLNFSGFIAWWLWRTIYLTKLPGVERKVRVVFDWTLDLFFSKDLVQLISVRGLEQLTRRYTAAANRDAARKGGQAPAGKSEPGAK